MKDREVAEAVRLERNFWQLVVLIALFFGGMGGAWVARLASYHAPNSPISIPTDRATKAVAAMVAGIDEAERSPQVDWKTPVLQAVATMLGFWTRCSVDPYGGACAVSWSRVLGSKKKPWTFIGCGDGQGWRVEWTRIDMATNGNAP